ncbi:MAG: class I SAM-dependent methyltransferase, partial [Dehalococcoidia bacterium]
MTSGSSGSSGSSGGSDKTAGHDEETKRFRLRDADREAAFFLPFLKPGMTLLDAGCGPGSITYGLAMHAAPGEVTGIDLDSARIETASRDIREAGVDNISYQVADVTNLPFEDDHFDAVFANGLIEHLSDPGVGINELLRVLKPGGVIGVRSSDWGVALLHPDTEGLRDSIGLRNHWQRHRGGHPNAGRHLRELLLLAGFLDVNADATAESHGTDAGTAEGVAYMLSILGNPELAAAAREKEWSTAHEIERMRQAWTDW